jgi:hypothetical protein
MKNFAPVALVVVVIQSVASAAEPLEFTFDGGVTVQIVEKPFSASKHDIGFCKSDMPCPCKVDGKWPFGTPPCELPNNKLEKLVVKIWGKAYRLNTTNMFNAFEGRGPELNGVELFTVSCKGASCVVKGAFSDGAGGYVAEWKIQDGKAKRTLLSADEAVMFPFMEAMQNR